MADDEFEIVDRAKPYKGRLPKRASRRAPEGVDVFEFGEPPRIENWRVFDAYRGLHQVLIGEIYGHPILGDCPNGAVTSRLIWISPEAGFARTRSRYYRLGAQAPRVRKRRTAPKGDLSIRWRNLVP